MWHCESGCVVESEFKVDKSKKHYRRRQAHPIKSLGNTMYAWDATVCMTCQNMWDDHLLTTPEWKELTEIGKTLEAINILKSGAHSEASVKELLGNHQALQVKIREMARVWFEARKAEVTEANKDKDLSLWA